jgi:hypothetical protein
LLQMPIETCLMKRRNQILLTSQSSGETTSELPLVMDSPHDQGKWTIKGPSAISPTICLTRGAAPFPQSSELSVNTRIGCQGNKSRTFAEQTELLDVGVPSFLFLFLYY